MWRDYFYFSKSQRRAILVLLLVIVLLVVLRWLLPSFKTVDEKENAADRRQYENFIRSLGDEGE